LVVPGEVADRQQLDAGIRLQLPMGGTQFTPDLAQPGFIQIALPVRLERLLQFTVAADARESQGVGNRHNVSNSCREKSWSDCPLPTVMNKSHIIHNQKQIHS